MKKILLVSDVKGWGGWVRGEYIMKHLSDEFDFTLVDNHGFIKVIDSKEFLEYDLIYLLFHTMLMKKRVKKLFAYKSNVVTIVTGFPTLKPCFNLIDDDTTLFNFRMLASGCKAIFANNIKSLMDLEIKKPMHLQTYYLPRGVDENIFYPEDVKRNNKFTVLYVGKPVPEKGLNEFIEPACRQIGVKLIINDRNYTNALNEDQMRRLYNKADCYIVASSIDGTPNPALEAAACGLPIISNEIGNMPEFIKHGKNGLLIKNSNKTIDKYVYAIRKLMNDREKCKEMGKEARKTILESWTWKKVLENERLAFREILNG
jgi:glycosyltransferase involved in cell wall biosynthesis